MKYFNPSYWFKLWVLSAPLFNDKTQGINAKSIDNKKIKDWASNNTNLQSINQEISYTNSSTNYQPYNLNQTNQNIAPIYQSELETSTHKHRHEKSRNRLKRQPEQNNWAFNVNIPLFSQENVVWCAIATSEAILRNLGLNINNFLIRINLSREGAGLTEYSSFQHYLSERMNVEYLRNENNEIIGGGVYSQNVVNVINDIIRSENIQTQPYTIQFFHTPRYFGLQTTAGNIPGNTVYETISNQWNHLSETLDFERNIRHLDEQLGLPANLEEANRRINEQIQANIEIEFRDNFFRNLDSLVRLSLQNNMPLIFGQGFQPTYRAYGGYAGHSILIVSTSSNGNNPQEDLSNIRYRVIDPSTGQYAIYTARDLYYAGGDIFSLISSNSNNLQLQNIRIDFSNFPNNNQGNNARFLQEIVRPALHNFLLFNFIYYNQNINCNNRRLGRDLKSSITNLLNNKFCDLKPEIDKIQGKITAIKVLDENNKGRNLKVGDIYVGTTEGLYLIGINSFIYKVDNIDDKITSLKNFSNDDFVITTKNGEIYMLNTDRISSDGVIFGERLLNIESSDLNKELKLYYNDDKSGKIYSQNWGNNKYYNKLIQDFNLLKINPLNYKKIEFFGKDENFKKTRISWGDEPYWPNRILSYFNGRNLDSSIITNEHIISNEGDNSINSNKIKIQEYATRWWGPAWVDIYQSVGLTWYWKDNDYHFQILDSCYGRTGGSIGGTCFLGLGSGIRLYNDDTFETQIPNPNDRKKREIFEEKNVTKWTDEFTKSINHEQHLPITNKTNFVTSNITSL